MSGRFAWVVYLSKSALIKKKCFAKILFPFLVAAFILSTNRQANGVGIKEKWRPANSVGINESENRCRWTNQTSMTVGPITAARIGELRTQKLKSHLLRTQSLKVLPLKPGVYQYIAIHATLTARDFFLANFYPSGPFTRPTMVRHICLTFWSSRFLLDSFALSLTPVSFAFLHSVWNPSDHTYSRIKPLFYGTLSRSHFVIPTPH